MDHDTANDDKNLERDTKRQPSDSLFDDGDVLQPVWIRHSPVLADRGIRKYMEGQLRFVLYSGVIFYILYCIAS